MPLAGLTPAEPHFRTEIAQRFLASTFDSVETILHWQSIASSMAADVDDDDSLSEQSLRHSQDLLRATIVFVSAGLDAVLKQLIRDTLPTLLGCNALAHKKFLAFTESRVAGEAGVRSLARYLAAE